MMYLNDKSLKARKCTLTNESTQQMIAYDITFIFTNEKYLHTFT